MNYPKSPSWMFDSKLCDLESRYRYMLEGVFCSNHVGMLSVLEVSPLDSVFEVLFVEIAESFQGRGLGFKMLNEWISALPSKSEIWLELRASNLRALALYKKLGFRKEGQRKDYYKDGTSAVVMLKQVST